MTWPEFQAWQRFAARRRIEKMNNDRRQAAGLPPVSRPVTPDHGPQERPPWEED